MNIIKNVHTISILVSNKPGVLVRVALVFAKRGYNIDSLVVSPAFNPDYSRMTITAQGDPETLEQIIKQVGKLIDVIHAEEHSDKEAVHQELVLFKLNYTKSTKPIISKLVKQFSAQILDDSENSMIIQYTNTSTKADEFEMLLKKYNVVEMVRSGKLAITCGKEKT
ncbi:Acetolactate synthase small subunit [hydrothermal vent metagenome]|uniref:Acetolactate synthase small subunit n=1 Tax=hydrothermal vent metagenome TaxID=652676 RepID=A0A3B1CWA7_9ZZZZ